MRLSHLFGRTLRETPADAEMVSHRLLLRAGMIRPLGTGIYSYLPLGWRVATKIMNILRQEMDAIDGQELLMPVVHPAEVWQASGRWDSVDETLLRFRDRSGHDMALAMTHEEVVADLLRREVDSYRQLPMMVYHIQTKFRDEPRSRGGLVRVREFLMKDAYSVHADAASLDEYYPKMVQAYKNIFARCGVSPLPVEADLGMMGDTNAAHSMDSHEFILLNEDGEDTVVTCEGCAYAANTERATFAKPKQQIPAPASVAQVETPNCKTIEEVACFIGVPTAQTLKAVFWATQEAHPQLVFAVIRGDLEVNEVKLSNAVGGKKLRVAEESEIRAVGAVPGYASPMGVKGALVVADDSVHLGGNFVAGANKEGYHLTGVNYGRDFTADIEADIALARDGDRCLHCGGVLHTRRGIELGHCFKLGTRYTERNNITFNDADGTERPFVMGSYGIGVGRLMAAVVEEHHDEYGIAWPPSVAPFRVHLVSLAQQGEVFEQAEALYERLLAASIEALYDDRPDLSAGVKFNDADLIGCPLRITVSSRSLQNGGVEVKRRSERGRTVISLDKILAYVQTADR